LERYPGFELIARDDMIGLYKFVPIEKPLPPTEKTDVETTE
jgi:hypothetical protein